MYLTSYLTYDLAYPFTHVQGVITPAIPVYWVPPFKAMLKFDERILILTTAKTVLIRCQGVTH
jgi:hypothetical protein